ncbi:UNVERIFIED_CONTAM: hypothetical protein GTU68_003727 [Idotea baltica]|nr:hypothetical protein [Idotea baltica]
MKYHPDRNPDDKSAEDRFKEAAEAYEVLSDEQKKARYDRFGHAGMEGMGGGGGFSNAEDIFSQFGDIFGDIFGGGGARGGFGGGGRGRTVRRGSNLRVRVKLTMNEIANGANKKIKVKKLVPADGKGNAGPMNGPAGDLIILIEELPHEHFERRGQDIIYNLPIAFADAALGTSVEVPTLEKTVKIKIPAGTQPGKVFRLRDKGLPSINSYGKGDLMVAINVFVPKKINDKERELLEQLRTAESFQPGEAEKNDKGFFDRMRDMFGG